MKMNYQYPKSLIALAGILFAGVLLFSSCKKDKVQQPAGRDTFLNFESVAVPSSNQVSTSATGTLSAKFNEKTNELSYTFTWKGLTGKISEFHIHKGDRTVIDQCDQDACPTTIDGTFSGATTLTQKAWIQDLKAGKLYAQINTSANPGGELVFNFKLLNASTSDKSNDDNHSCDHQGGYDDSHG